MGADKNKTTDMRHDNQAKPIPPADQVDTAIGDKVEALGEAPVNEFGPLRDDFAKKPKSRLPG
ncbi:hypothetical protein [Paracoccus pantotrophus]|uniref:hypothetical protein n=1 Tax=Paracoccus pantotrophus TaxID=82367 RepID=UPI0004643425|nr:hypothetical protein [Paracoccus pantotrophus]RDD95669.1 hypothetical protein DTW92_15725 [Paracoccus pantotrophus]WGR66163.1 hypothetical protein E3U24_12645 [Paracoccus pantotrophus]